MTAESGPCWGVARAKRAPFISCGTCRSSKLSLRRIDGPCPQRMPAASGCSVCSRTRWIAIDSSTYQHSSDRGHPNLAGLGHAAVGQVY